MDGRHDEGWNKTRPYGQEADELLQLVNEYVYVLVLSLRYHTLLGEAVNPIYRKSKVNIGRLYATIFDIIIVMLSVVSSAHV